MSKTKFYFLIVISIMAIRVQAQALATDSLPELNDIFSVLQDDTFGGKISLYQNPSLHVLVDKYARINEKNGLNGYRIQIYSGIGNNAREKAVEMSKEFLNTFPEFDADLVYTDYVNPYFKVRIGDYRDKNEAYEFYNKVIKKFPGSYIVKSTINFPKLELPEGK